MFSFLQSWWLLYHKEAVTNQIKKQERIWILKGGEKNKNENQHFFPPPKKKVPMQIFIPVSSLKKKAKSNNYF